MIQCIQKKEKEIYKSVPEAAQERAKASLRRHGKATGEVGKQLHLRIREMTTHKKGTADSTIGRLKTEDIYNHIIQGRVLAGAGCLTSFKRWDSMENVKFAREADSADRKAEEEF